MRATIPSTAVNAWTEGIRKVQPGHVLVVTRVFDDGSMNVVSARSLDLQPSFFPGFTASHPITGALSWFPYEQVGQVIPAHQRFEGVTVPRSIELRNGHGWYVIDEHAREEPAGQTEAVPKPAMTIGG